MSRKYEVKKTLPYTDLQVILSRKNDPGAFSALFLLHYALRFVRGWHHSRRVFGIEL